MPDDRDRRGSGSGGGGGGGGCGSITIGGILAAVLSYMSGNSVGWVIIHFFCGWFYVVYLCFGCGGGLPFDFWSTPANEIVPVEPVMEIAEEAPVEEVDTPPPGPHVAEELYPVTLEYVEEDDIPVPEGPP